jgi:hypothetical protein
MSLSRFFQVRKRDQRATRRTRRPTISHLRFESLEQRALLSVSPFVSSASDPPVKYEIIAPEQTNVGATAHFEVIALDAAGEQARGYSGTASLAEMGAATTATQLVVFIPAHETAGQAVNVVVEALDAAGHVVPNYTGTVTLTSPTDASATLPSPYQFTASDAGRHTFQVTFSAGSGTGQQTITATDNSTPQLTGSVSTNLTSPMVVTHLGVTIPENVQVGVPVDVLVTALNANNRPVSSYTGTVSFAPAGTSTSASETLPASYTFTSGHWWRGDNGRHEFQVTFNAAGSQSFVVTDGSGNTSPTVTTNVYAAPAVTSLQIVAPDNIPEGVAVPVKVEALDAAYHVVKVFSDTVTLSAGSATVTGPTTPNSGTQGKLIFKVTAPTSSAGSTITLTATDTTATLTATATVNVITPHAHSHGSGGEHWFGRFAFGRFSRRF